MSESPRSSSVDEEERDTLLQHHEVRSENEKRIPAQSQVWWCPKPNRKIKHVRISRCTLITCGILAILAVLAAFVLFISRRMTASSSDIHGVAQLRDEKDYIIGPEWDFDAAPVRREYYWTIAETTLNPDGVFRPMLLINNTFPGPMIECNENDEIVVHVNNQGTNATAIHWHGIYQNGTNWMDGTVGVTQCPIAPGHTFTYRFNVTGQTGSYFYHSHMSMQTSDGLTGPLVIHPRSHATEDLKSLRYDQDRVVLLSDHYYDLSSELLMQYLAPGNENNEPVPASALINGRNVRECVSLPHRQCSSNGLQHAIFDLLSSASTRLRIINVAAFAEFSLQIDEHGFQVTEVDGVDVTAQPIHRLNISPAQRYSLIITPPTDRTKDAYWMRARMITHCFGYEEPELQEEVRAIIRYNDFGKIGDGEEQAKEASIPQSQDWSEIIEVECRDLNTSALEPVIPLPAPAQVDHAIYLRSSFQIRDWALSRGYLNDSSYRVNHSHPVLRTLLQSPAASPASLPIQLDLDSVHFDPATQLVHHTTGIATVDILIQNFDDGNHPFHLHGYKFWVLAQGHGYPPPTSELYASLNLTNPLRRDVASVEAFGWTLLRFVADNPGVWAFHCHIGWHTEAGLMMVFANRMEEMRATSVPKDVTELCEMHGIERGMTPSNDIWFGQVID